MKILYLSYDGLTDPLGQSQILPYIIGLCKNGHTFDIISFEKPKRFKQNKALIENICQENGIAWHPLSYTKKPAVFSTVWDIFKLKRKARKLHRIKQFQLLHCRSYIASLVGLKMKKKYNIKFLFDMRGFWADERIDGGLWDKSKILYKLIYVYFKKKEKQFILQSDKIVSLTESGKKELLDNPYFPINDNNKIAVIPCAADYDLFELQTSKKKAEAKKQLGINKDQFTLLYIGSIGTWYMLEEMMAFFCQLRKRKTGAKFLLLTPGKADDIMSIAKKYGIEENDLIIQFTERNKITLSAHAADYGIFFIKPLYSKISSSPTKMGEMMSMGIPLIANNIADVKSIIEKIKAGFCIDEMNNNTFEHIIEEMDKLQYSAEMIRNESRYFFDLQKGIDAYDKLYLEL